MSDDWSFSFSLPDLPKGKRISAEEAEKILLDRLEKCQRDVEEATWQLVRLYSFTGRQKTAFSYVKRLIASTDDPEKKALFHLTMGQLMEQVEDFKSAISFYSQALSMEPAGNETWYFIHNNLGYCLNHFGRYAEAEPYCRAAIRINPDRHNAYKNLGVALEGQGHFAEAARCYIKAVRTEAADPRALKHLEDLIGKHQDISAEIPDILDQLEKCREAVRTALEVRLRLEKAAGDQGK